MRKATCLAVLLVASGCASVNITERGLIPARRAESDRAVVPGAVAATFPGVTYEEQRIEAADGTALYGALLRQPGADLTVLYFGGNESTVERFGLETAQAFLPLGVNVLLVDHRGYGWSDGTPTVDLLQSDALAVFDHLAALPDVGGIVVHGLSLGSFLAGHVGASRPAAGVVLESSATTPQEWAEVGIPRIYKLFARVRVEEPLRAVDNRAEVERIEEPLLLLVGDEDDTTPPVLSRRLYAASPLPESRKTLVIIEGGGHGDVQEQPMFAGAYRTFLDQVRAARAQAEAAPAQSGESLAFALARGVERVARAHVGPQALWPGFDPLAVPLAVYDGERTTLFRHPAPPEGFVPVPDASPAALVYEGRHEAMSANSSAEIGGVQTATVLLDRPALGRSPDALAALAVHEAFHVYQRERHPRWSGNEADLFVYPTDSVELLALRRLETEALRRALAAEEADDASCWSREALTLRQERYTVLDSASAAYERGTELNEGLATYVEGRAAGRATVDLPAGEFGPAEVRRRAYATGPALALLLDRFAPEWRASFEADDRETLDAALALALGSGETCAFDDADAAEAGRRAGADVAALAAAREARVAAFEGRSGWRVVVEAAGQPLWPQGFDPLNVERVGSARVLHGRFLRLGNGAGQLEVLDAEGADAEALTEGAGPHPLFNGVQRVVTSGLPEPEVSESEGAVTVRAPGFTAEFRGASLTRVGETLTIRLGP